MATLAFLILAILVAYSQQHSYNLGECPNVTPQPDFAMEKFLGIWYVMRKTSTSSTCIWYNFTDTNEPNHYQLEQVSNTFVPLKHNYHYTGELTVPDPSVPSKMKVKFPLNVGSASYTVFMTDYDNYAAIFTCQKMPIGNRQSVSILSRRKFLDKLYMDKIQQRMSSFGINPYDLSIISQEDCKQDDGYNVNIDDDTFSVKSVAGVFRKAGEKIGDGFEYVAGGAKKIINKYSGDDDDDKKTTSGKVATHPDAEWIP